MGTDKPAINHRTISEYTSSPCCHLTKILKAPTIPIMLIINSTARKYGVYFVMAFSRSEVKFFPLYAKLFGSAPLPKICPDTSFVEIICKLNIEIKNK